MMKRFIAGLLCVALLLTVAPMALARGEDSITLSSYAGLISNDVFQYYSEFTNYNAARIVMSPGERITTPAFHAALSAHLSFSGISVVSSDPSVATAKACDVGRSPVNGQANIFKGLEIVAHDVGTTTITASFDTYVQGDLQDRRGTTHQTKTFTVVVSESSLDVDLAFSANEALVDWTQGYKDRVLNQGSWAEAQELLQAQYGMDVGQSVIMLGTGMAVGGLTSLAVYGTLLAAGVTAATGVGIPLAAGLVGFAAGTAISANVFGPSDLSSQAVDGVTAALQTGIDMMNKSTTAASVAGFAVGNGISIGASAAMVKLNDMQRRKAEEMKFLASACINPSAVTLSIRVTNTGDQPVSGATLYLNSQNLSLTCTDGPQSEERTLTVPALEPGQVYTDTLTVYPSVMFRQTPSNGEKELVYEGSMFAECVYQDMSGQSHTVDAAATLPVYSRLDQTDLATCQEEQQKAAAYYATVGDKNGNTQRTAEFACPVSVTLMDASGKELAVLAQEGDSYQDEKVLAFVSGESKLLTFRMDAINDYRVSVTAIGDGEMNVLGLDSGGLLNLSGYEAVPLTKGDTFEVDIASQLPVQISGGSGAIPPIQVLNQETLCQSLEETDISQEYLAMTARAFCAGWVPENIMITSYQQEMNISQLSVLLIYLYELQCGMPAGDLTANYLAETGDSEDLELPIRVAQWTQLLPELPVEEPDPEEEEAQPVSLAQQTVDWQLFNETVLGVLTSTGTVTNGADALIPGEPVTLGAAYAALGRLYTCVNSDATQLVAQQIPQLQEQTLAELFTQDEINGYTFRYHQQEEQTTLLRSFSIQRSGSLDGLTGDSLYSVVLARIKDMLYVYENDILTEPDAAPVDAKALTAQLNQSSMSMYFLGTAGSFTQDGKGYLCAPLYFVSSNKLYKDQVYLAILSTWTDEELGERNEITILADQAQVKAFLRQAFDIHREHENVQDYVQLENGMEGEAVLRLQRALAAKGCLKGEPSGVYDSATASAVRAYKKEIGMTQNNVADEVMQRVLYGSLSENQAILESWLNAEA